MNNHENKNKKIWAKRFFFFITILIFLNFIYLLGYWSGQRGGSSGLVPGTIAKLNIGKPDDVNFSLFWEAWNKLKEKSPQDESSEKMVEGAISGMLASTGDPYTVYFTKDENKRFREDIQGEFSGIGIEMVLKNGMPTVVAPLSDTPAEKAGFRPGDVLIEVDGAKTKEIGFEETINRIRGQEGTTVKLKVERENVSEPILIAVLRQRIVVKSVQWEMKNINGDKIAYVKIRQFGDDTESLFNDAANDILKEKPKGIVLDLRKDPGGYLETAVNVASYFIKDGIIVSEKGRNDNTKDYRSTGNGKLAGIKVAVLVDSGSASASEILAGALKDRLGSKIIGEKTFGKGSVQELIDLSDGSAVKITVAKWFTPNGKQINDEGIEPDIKIVDDEKTIPDEQEDRALEFMSKGE